MADDDWKNEAVCAGVEITEFYEAVETKGRAAQLAKIRKQYCNRCPVKDRCLMAGMNESFGIWGGNDIRDRNKMRRNNALDTAM